MMSSYIIFTEEVGLQRKVYGNLTLVIGFAMASVFFYLEFFVTLVVSLQMQGFKNPAIYALDVTHPPVARFSNQLAQVLAGWNYLTSSFGSVDIAMAGDSTGASLVLSFLLHIANPSPEVTMTEFSKKPVAALLISPWTHMFGKKHECKSDYINQRVVDRYAKSLADIHEPGNSIDTSDVYHSPGLCHSIEWWTRAFPELGIYIAYGEAETLAPEIEDLYLMLRQCGKIKIEAEPNQIHSWPIATMYMGRTQEDREAGVELISTSLAKMMLWRSDTTR